MDTVKIRAANLRLLRDGVVNTGQRKLSSSLNITQSQYSLYERGIDSLDDRMTRQIEDHFKLPSGWMDRDNLGLLLTAEEFELICNLRRFAQNQQSDLTKSFDNILNIFKS